MAHYLSAIYQLFPGKPKYTEKDIPDLSGKVTIVLVILYQTLIHPF
jgi:retinol dehydrogenase 12